MKRVFICFLPLVTLSTAFSSDRLMNTEFLESL